MKKKETTGVVSGQEVKPLVLFLLTCLHYLTCKRQDDGHDLDRFVAWKIDPIVF